ncbi:MAG: hypothetical protein WAV00_23135 [Nocardioides sp.]
MVSEKAFLAGRPRSNSWERVAHGLFVPLPTTDPDARLHALASRLHPDGGYTHLSAARLFGWWLPPLPPGLPEFAAQSDTRNRPRRDELRIIRTTPEPEIHVLRGLPVVPPLDVLLALARHLSLLDHLVVLDSALHLGHITPRELDVALRSRRWGVRLLRSSAALADGRSESPYETLLRVLHKACEVAVEPQHELWVEGEFVARGDLGLIGHAVFHEYDGAVHREQLQQREDLRRERAIGSAGWARRGYTDLEVLHRPIEILRDADRSLGRPHDPSRIDAWYALLRESCFTPAGRELLRKRLGIPN